MPDIFGHMLSVLDMPSITRLYYFLVVFTVSLTMDVCTSERIELSYAKSRRV